MGGHARFVGRSRDKEQSSEELVELPELQPALSHQTSAYLPRKRTDSYPLGACVQCSILLLGKMGHGKSTLGNRMLDPDGFFKINDQQCPQTETSQSCTFLLAMPIDHT